MKAQLTAAVMKSPPAQGPPANRREFASLARDHHRLLLVYARALAGDDSTAADLVQDAFVAAWRSLGRFDITRDFAAWMRGIIRNKWRDHLRRHSREVDVDDATLEAWENQLARWEPGRGEPELFDALDDCLGRLPEAMRDAVRRFYYQNESGELAASATGLDPAAFRKRLQRSRDLLRDCLDHKSSTHS